jgi:acyl transferase domain-containing protein/thioesterase domain-containing protein
MLPEVLGQLVGGPPRRRRNQAPVLERIAGAPAADRGQIVLDLVREHAASVLGYTAGSDIEPTMAFKDLGFDSLGAVELRNRLAAATGLSLPPALVFDHPSAAVLAEHLLAELEGAEPAVANVVSTRSAHDEPVAIVGMACRYPGGATSPEGLWRLVDEGVDAIGGFPADRGWDVESIYDPDPERAGTSYVREGGFVAGATEFDPAFFGIGPREARSMDPQQRLLLETCWEALEDAGVDPLSLRGTPTGIFAGASPTDYGLASALEGSDEYAMTGTSASVLSGRVAYTLGLEGPALTLDTACSSSLVALHLACQALRGGECSLALAAGVSIFASPVLFVASSRMRALALDGRSKSFAEGADGTGVSEGVGVLLVERLSDARRNGHPVLGVVRGSAVNQDGASNGLTAPNGPAQQRVIRQALADAGLAPQEVDAVEAHGTGTALGDPIEAGALLATYGRDRDEPLRLGAIKSNIGHPQAAAGMAGVIKMTMAMREGTLPKTLHAERPSSLIDWSAGAVELLSESRPWPAGGSPRRAAVSSFGVSGTNAHVILEEPPPAEEPAVSGSGGGEEVLRPDVVPLLVSAKSEAPLREQAARLAARLDADPECSLLDLAHSLAAGRAQLEQRAVVLAADREQALERLRMLAEGKAGAGIVRGRAKPAGKVAFLFAGYGSQWPGMALDLIESAPVFARHMRECAAALDPHLDWSIEDVLRGANGAPPLDRVDVGPPALFAVMSSLARLWMACGVKPSVVVGHSQGELTAAYLAGGLSLEDAARAMALRSKLLMKLVGKGAMAAVGLGTAELAPRLERWDGKIEIAVLNGPASTVLAGQPETLDDLLAELQAEGLRAKYVPGVVAPGHSSYVEPVREELLEVFAPISPRSGDVPFHSTVAAGLVDTAELDAEYWYRNLRGTVQLEPVVRDLLSGGARALIEMSPHPALAVSLQETVDAALSDPGSATVLGSLRRGEGGLERFASSLAEAHVAGLEVDWGVFFAGARRVKLPTYPFQRKRYWLEDGAAPRGRRPVEGPADSAEAATDPQPSTLRERLAVAPSREREEMALAQVREQVAAQLGYDSAAEIDPERPLLELGLDSVGAMAVRKRLIETTGAELPVAALVDRPTVVSVARRLSAVIGGEGGEEAEGGAPTTLLTLLRGAQGHEQRTAVMDLIAEASRFRPFFDSDGAASRAPAPVRLAEGEEQPALLLLPSVAAMSGAREYARFAAPFRGRRMVEVYPAPGFERGEALPASVEACAEAQAAAILGGEPPSELVLAGHSSGGWLAHATAARLEGMGVYPKAVILLDTYLQDERVFAWLEPSLMDALREAGDSMALVDDVRLTAMTAYFRVFSEWRPAAIQAPTVMVRAAEPMPAMDRADPEGWRASWPLPHEAVEARGNHFSMMTEEAESTAATVLKALEALRVPSTPPTMR